MNFHELKLIGYDLADGQSMRSCPVCGIGRIKPEEVIDCLNSYHNLHKHLSLPREYKLFTDKSNIGNTYYFATLVDKPIETAKKKGKSKI